MSETKLGKAVPDGLQPLVECIVSDLAPAEIWLFGSRARGDAQPESDWDLLVALPDDSPDAMLDPALAWTLGRASGVKADIIVAHLRDIEAVWGIPNTLGYDLGLRPRATRCAARCRSSWFSLASCGSHAAISGTLGSWQTARAMSSISANRQPRRSSKRS